MIYRGTHKPRGGFDDVFANGDRAGNFAALNIFNGTNGDDMLSGTAGDDLFKPKRGNDIVDGDAGIDRLRVDYSGSTEGGSSSLYLDVDGLSGYLGGGLQSSCQFANIESLHFTAGDGSDFVSAALSLLVPGPVIDIDGGGGVNTLNLQTISSGASVVFEVDASGTATSNLGVFENFQSYFLIGGDVGDHLGAGAGNDFVSGGNGKDVLGGGDGADQLYGGRGDDIMNGGEGADQLLGGTGADLLTGGAGPDQFEFLRIDGNHVDRITDFSHAEGDRIDVSAIDADKSAPHNQAFTFIGAGDFTGAGAELRAQDNGDGYTIQGDVDHDGVADFQLLVQTSEALVASDFVL